MRSRHPPLSSTHSALLLFGCQNFICSRRFARFQVAAARSNVSHNFRTTEATGGDAAKPASSIPKRRRQKGEAKGEAERERESGFKTLEIWGSVVKPWINLSVKARRRTRYRVCNIDMQTSSRLAYRVLIDFRNVFSAPVVGNKVGKSIPGKRTFAPRNGAFPRWFIRNKHRIRFRPGIESGNSRTLGELSYTRWLF